MNQADLPKPRRGLSAYALIDTLRRRFDDVPDRSLLMFLAFAVDQIQEACYGLFNSAVQRAGRRIRLWESIRSHLHHFDFTSLAELYQAIASGRLCKPSTAY